MRQLISATTTPLASIFGSGFLVIVPILAGAVGEFSVFAMAAICLLAFLVGEVIRHNILSVELALQNGASKITLSLERLSDVALIVAYVISVCLYLHILSAFVLAGLDIESHFADDMLTTCVIVFITLIGLTKGLQPLEKLEKWALYVTLAIIIVLCAAFAYYDGSLLSGGKSFQMPQTNAYSNWQILTILAGTLIVVQGFETSRYLGASYPSKIRVASSRLSQIIATVVYLSFVALTLPAVHLLNGVYNDNSLIELVGYTAALLVAPLILAATLSQFSAAVADTLAAAGNLNELSNKKVPEKLAYLLIGMAAVALTWTVDTFTVLALASRAFALYYFLQCLVALTVTSNIGLKLFFTLMACILAFITLFAVPVG
ncbi:hypothetical protein ACFO4O_14490 [Glaciecola siphonariae]|uniref:Amino acid permease n=1 Tax=Glaciecola siphonariae TaxID=521012 RepID=A0ABV9LZT6_9ALTE